MDITIQIFEFLMKECQALLPIIDSISTGPTLRLRGPNITLAYNFYCNSIKKVWNSLTDILETFLDTFKSKGEFLIHYGHEGEIIDSGYHGFQIKQSKLIEAYFYEQEVFLYLRVLWEVDPQQSNISLQHDWISLDADIILESAWFAEEKYSLTDLKKFLLELNKKP